MPEDIVLTLLKEIRADAKDFREETRKNFGIAFHRLSVLEATMASLKADMDLPSLRILVKGAG